MLLADKWLSCIVGRLSHGLAKSTVAKLKLFLASGWQLIQQLTYLFV